VAEVRELHRLIFFRAWPDIAGRFRTVEVDAFPHGDLPPHPSLVPSEMAAFDAELKARSGPPADPVRDVEIAIWSHMELVRIHPFQEGNGKTARLLMNVLLMRSVTGPTRPLDIPADLRTRYLTCVRLARRARPQGFQALVLELLDTYA
jgi:Fic family protein